MRSYNSEMPRPYLVYAAWHLLWAQYWEGCQSVLVPDRYPTVDLAVTHSLKDIVDIIK